MAWVASAAKAAGSAASPKAASGSSCSRLLPMVPASTLPAGSMTAMAAGRLITTSPSSERRSPLPTTAAVSPASWRASARAPGRLGTSAPASRRAAAPAGTTISPSTVSPERRSATSAAVAPSRRALLA